MGWGWFQDESSTVGFQTLWESHASADLTGDRAQVAMRVMGSGCKHRWSFTRLPTTHLLWDAWLGTPASLHPLLQGEPLFFLQSLSPGLTPSPTAIAPAFRPTSLLANFWRNAMSCAFREEKQRGLPHPRLAEKHCSWSLHASFCFAKPSHSQPNQPSVVVFLKFQIKYPCFPEMSWKSYFHADTLLTSFYLEAHF